ncbi:MAG: DciA family protein [Betaproteobacteria bacterium]
MPQTRIDLLLDSLPELQSLNRELKKLATLQRAISEVLPGDLAKSTSVVSGKSGTVLLYAANSPVAAKVKQLTPRMMTHLRQHGYDITAIHVQVQVRISHNPLLEKHISLGPLGRDALDSLAKRLDSSPLKSAVQRLRHR